MDDSYSSSSMLELFLFETNKLIEQVEQAIISGEKMDGYTPELINEIFHAMHNIKGLAAMMMFADIAKLAHSIEDVLYFLREHRPKQVNYAKLTNLVLDGSYFIKVEALKLRHGDEADGNADLLIEKLDRFLSQLKGNNSKESNADVHSPDEVKHDDSLNNDGIVGPGHAYFVHINFEEQCEMENVRAYSIIHNLKEHANDHVYMPSDIVENEDSAQVIRKEGFKIWFRSTLSYEELQSFFMQTSFLKTLELSSISEQEWPAAFAKQTEQEHKEDTSEEKSQIEEVEKKSKETGSHVVVQQSLISVEVSKLDKLLDLVGELVISEAMVTHHPDIQNAEQDSLLNAANRLHKIMSEIQNMVMSIRMVSLATTFHRMHRIVRDMCQKQMKEVDLNIVNEGIEVDKNIIEHITDPLKHVVRNAIDHGIELPEQRLENGKKRSGTVTLEARNTGSDVLITIKDDGRGLNKECILERARSHDMLHKPEHEMTDKEVYSLIFRPGFSTKDEVSEFSGRGVGMDVIVRNIESIGGSVWVESEPGLGTTVYFKIPLSLAIVEGMNIKIGSSFYTIPITAVKESFRVSKQDVIKDPGGSEMLIVRGESYPIVRLHEKFAVKQA